MGSFVFPPTTTNASPQAQKILNTLWVIANELAPSHIEIYNDSENHSRGNDYSHFRLIIVAEVFNTMTRMQRHQKVYAAASDVLQHAHSLALHLYTPTEWKGKSPSNTLCQHST